MNQIFLLIFLLLLFIGCSSPEEETHAQIPVLTDTIITAQGDTILVADDSVYFVQHPFDFGQNSEIYFLSKKVRDSLEIHTIVEINEYKDVVHGGMGERWGLEITTFSENEIKSDWHIISDQKFNSHVYDEMMDASHFVNGGEYVFEEGILVEYGGYGYGSFDWKEFDRSKPGVSQVYTRCNGHCGPASVEHYSENIFNEKGQVIYTLVSSEIPMNSAEDMEYNTEGQPADITYTADTIFYQYNKHNQIAAINNTSFIEGIYTESRDDVKYHQIFVNGIEMEKCIKVKLGYCPKLLLIEIYQYGVFAYFYNNKEKKYYQGRGAVLEQ